MVRDILIDVCFGENQAAILEDGCLVELYIERADQIKTMGNIYRGKVEKVLPGMQAAFVDIGTGKNAFLYAADALERENETKRQESESGTPAKSSMKIEDLVKPGQDITVQVIKEPIESKGARVTKNITLPGRNIVLTPTVSGIGISKKINDPTERERLKALAVRLCPAGMGLIVRTVAEATEEEELANDIGFLIHMWENILQKERYTTVPGCIYQEPGLIRKLARDYLNEGIHRFIVNDRAEFDKLLAFLDIVAPGLKTKVNYFSRNYDLFAFYHVESAIQKALSRKVWLKCGGYLVFDKTEALTVIDVNTGKFIGKDNQEETIFKTNLEAAGEIARQIRLRDISGIILVDFIDMKEASHKEKILKKIKEITRRDRTKVFVIGMTNLGLVEITRKKVNHSLRQVLTIKCPLCGGGGRILSPQVHAERALKTISDVLAHSTSSEIEVEVHPDVYSVLFGPWRGCVERMEQRYQKNVRIISSASGGYEKVSIREL